MDGKIIVNAEMLNPAHVPDKMPYRERELDLVSSNATQGVNTFIHGPPGSGKTALAKTVCIQSSSTSRRVLYIDCSLYQTVNSVLREILTDRLVFSRSNYDLLKRLNEKTKTNKATVFLDHFDRTRDPDIVSKLVGIGLSVAIVGTNEDTLDELDLRTRSLISSIISFGEYTIDQAFSLLKARAELALTKWTFKESTLRKIAEKTKGNIAVSLNILRASGLRAESQGKKTIEEIEMAEILRQHDCPAALAEDEKTLLNILEEQKSLPSNTLFQLYRSLAKYPKQDRSFRKYMQRLRERGLVRAVGDRTGRHYEIVLGGESV